MLISLEINDNKAKPFLEFLHSLDFVKIENSELPEDDYIQLLNERLAEYERDPHSGKDAREVLEKLKIKYGF